MTQASLLQSTAAAAMIVLSGGLYALLLALGRLRQSVWLKRGAALSYLVLVVFAFVLADSLHLEQIWFLVMIGLLIAYLLAPMAIWHLTHATHGGEITKEPGQ